MKEKSAAHEARLGGMMGNTPDKEETLILLLDEGDRIFKELRGAGK